MNTQAARVKRSAKPIEARGGQGFMHPQSSAAGKRFLRPLSPPQRPANQETVTQPKGNQMEILGIVKAIIAVAAIGAGTATFGPHQEPPKPETVAVTNDKGDVLYYNRVVK